MNLRLVLIVTVVLASAPILFAQYVGPDAKRLTGWAEDRGEATQAESARAPQRAGCLVIGPDLFRPGSPVGKAGNGNPARWNRPLDLPRGENLACAAAQPDGVLRRIAP